MRLVSLALGAALVATACGGDASPQTTPATTSAIGTATTVAGSTPTTMPAAPSTTGTGEEAPATTIGRQQPEGPPAPDFELALGQGGEFVLSAEQKPVYMVFWAEW